MAQDCGQADLSAGTGSEVQLYTHIDRKPYSFISVNSELAKETDFYFNISNCINQLTQKSQKVPIIFAVLDLYYSVNTTGHYRKHLGTGLMTSAN